MNIQRAGSWLAGKLGRQTVIVRWLRPWYGRALRALSADRGIEWTINSVPFRIDPRQRDWMGRHYDEPVARWLASRVKPGDLCVNVGANVGVYTLQCAYWSRPSGRVVAFEPNPHARAILEQHIRWNHMDDRVEVVDAAVSDRAGTASFFVDGTSDGRSRLGAANSALRAVNPIQVRTVTLDAFCHAAPDWLLIDVEGFEIQVLRGARQIIPKCRGLLVELHSGDWEVAGTSRADLERLLEEFSLVATPLSGQVDPFSEHGHVVLQGRSS